MAKLKVMTVMGTRPEIIKLSEIAKRCDAFFDHVLVHTGQNYDYELNEIFFQELGLRRPDHFLGIVGDTLGESIGNVIAKSYALMAEVMPDALLVLGDTNSCLCVIAAKRLKIPVFHLEAGNRCFDDNVPEEVNRRIVDHTSDVNLCYTEYARRNLIAEGLPTERTFVVGSPMREVLAAHGPSIGQSEALSRLNLTPGKYILLSAHREENIDIEHNFNTLMHSINNMAESFDMPVLYSVHPRSAQMIEKRGFVFHKNVRTLPPFGFFDYVALQKAAYCVVSDSGTLAEEGSILGFPGVSIRTSTERPEALDAGSFLIASLSEKTLVQSVDMAVEMNKLGLEAAPVKDYADTNVSTKVVRFIQSYTHIVNRNVWRKQ